MEAIAVFSGNDILYWSPMIIAAGVAACFALTCALYTARGGKLGTLLVFTPIAVVLSVLLSRALHWYCHIEQYAGFLNALTDYSKGSYCLPGAFVGVVLAALAVRGMKICANVPRLLDCLAPGAVLCIAFIRLSALFDSSCRSKIIVTEPARQHLPLASPIMDASGNVQYRFATFFVEFLVLLVLLCIILVLYHRRWNAKMKNGCKADGSIALLFLSWYGAVELWMDSTRYDSSFMHFNGFVSIVQMFCALSLLGVLIFFSIRSVRANGRQRYHWTIWGLWFLGLAGTGASEYLVQRFGGMYLICYSAMAVTCLLMASMNYAMYRTLLEKKDG